MPLDVFFLALSQLAYSRGNQTPCYEVSKLRSPRGKKIKLKQMDIHGLRPLFTSAVEFPDKTTVSRNNLPVR